LFCQTFRENYVNPALDGGWIKMTIPDTPNNPNQKYLLTEKGKALKIRLKKEKKKR